MEKLIEVSWSGVGDYEFHYADALVEYIRYDEDGKVINEITNVFLPEGIPKHFQQGCRTQAIEEFHKTL
jgi:hypothetical protein